MSTGGTHDRPYPYGRTGPWNEPRSPGEQRPKPWPSADAREMWNDRHEYVWELSDAAYENFRSWVGLVEAGDPEAVALAEEREILVVDRMPPGKRDLFRDPDDVFFHLADGLHNEIFDDPHDRDSSISGDTRRFEIRMSVARDIIRQVFGDDPGDLILLTTQFAYESQGDENYDVSYQRDRASMRIKLGIANARDLEIAEIGDDYWDWLGQAEK